MYEVTEETLQAALKPFDIVSAGGGTVGYIQEVNVNDCQSSPEYQISYSIIWLVGGEKLKSAWWGSKELTYHCNLWIEISKSACHPSGNNRGSVQRLFNHMVR